MKGKKVLDFILLRPVFTQKNFSAILIVFGLMGAYMLISGQRVLNVPNFDSSASFGTPVQPAIDQEKAKEILGVHPESDRDQRLESVAARNPLAGPDSRNDIEPVNHELGYDFEQQKRRQESELLKNELRKKDSLDTIAERLRISR